MSIVIAVIVALLIGNAPAYTYQPFDPSVLDRTAVEKIVPCSRFLCLFKIKEGKVYLVVKDRKREIQFVYVFVGDMNKPTLDLLWAKKMI